MKSERKRLKLKDVKATRCRLLGYDGGQIYILLDPHGKIVRSSNVQFEENRPHIPNEGTKRSLDQLEESSDTKNQSGETLATKRSKGNIARSEERECLNSKTWEAPIHYPRNHQKQPAKPVPAGRPEHGKRQTPN